ncbi:MAG: hypothetical protein M0R17_05550, partial [Candidatus Omnitrophica bacterium]|nr:hypothetical protein [Candidatus Omnitrophota bacterium]
MTNIDPNTIGNALYFILTKKEPYSKYISIYSSDQSLGKSTVPNLIIEVYNKYFKLQVNLNTQSKSNIFILQGGDVIKTGSGNTYLITHSEGTVGTWPKLTDIDNLEINSTIKQYEVIRPNFDNIKETLLEDLQNIGKEILSTDSETNRLLEQIPETLNNSKDIKSADGVDFYSLGEGALQIGDLIFVVDPTQLAFNSQNGYQYFPTLRTQGNPKIPTTQQVKNLSINLIFPNEDSINYQLLNLYAMFKRTPFVNIRNKDICEFFKDICFMEEWLPVALESIQIQSVPGFPNTLQASITILPFDYRMMSDGFQALLSMEDVERQQTILYRNEEYDRLIRKAESKLDEQSVSEERFLDVLIHDIDKSPDFRNSLPFRAFYQSLIADRKFIMNSSGKIVSTSKKGSYDIAWFRPTKTENLLNEYKASSNNKSITLSYNYISKDFQTFSKIVSNERTDKQVRLLKQLTDFYTSIRTKDDLIKEMVTFFTRKEDFYNITEGKFQELSNNIIPNLVTRFGITMEGQSEVIIKNWFDLLTKGFAIKQGWVQTFESIQSINNFFGGNFSVDNTDVLGFLNGVTYTDKDTFGVGTFQWGIKKIWDWIDTGTDKQKELKKKNFSAFLGELRVAITKEITSETLVVNPTADGEMFSIARIPIVSEDIVIDNVSDIIVGWSIVFSNKFIPMTLQAYKYPYYQHIGSEDPVMSLNITSIYNKNKDLKSQLSILSERLHESAKVVTLNAPELITYLDPRITINAEANNLFNSFGIKKVVFDSFNIVNIDGQPNSWNIAVNFTQSNFTISDYHGVSHVPSNEIAILELAKIVSSIEKINDNYVVMDYKTRSGNLLNLNDILKIRFLAWSVSNIDQKYNIIEYIKQVKSGRQSKNTGTIGNELADKYLQEFYKSIGSLESFSLSQPNTTENFNVREVNITKTKILQDLISNTQYKNILDFINIKTEELFKLKSELIRSLIFNDKSWFRNYLDRYDARYRANPILLPYVIAIFDTIELEQKNKVTSKLSPIFNSMEESFSSMVSIDFADKILRDPVVYKKIITPEIIGETQFNNIERYKKLSRVNCYNDFDIPNFSDTVVLGPDFYLYNNIVDISENRYYISESLKRYAKIGKLGAMMSLVESTDALIKYDQIISQLESIEPEVKEAVSVSLADDIPGYTSDGNIKEIIAKLKNIQTQISLCNNSIDEINTISDDNQQLLDKFKNDFENNLYPGMKKEEFDTAYKIMESKVSKLKSGITVENIDFKKINLIHSARTMTMLEIFEIYSVLNNYIIDEISSKNNIFQMKPTKLDDQGLTKSSSEKEVAQKLYNYVRFVLINNKNITTSSLESGGTFSSDSSTEDNFKKELKKQFSAGGISDSFNKTLSLPNLRNIQNYLFNK